MSVEEEGAHFTLSYDICRRLDPGSHWIVEYI